MNQAIISNFVSQTVPKFLEKKTDNIIYFGEDNLFPYDIIDLYNDSSTHNAIINGKIGYVVGQGLYSEDPRTQQWLDKASLNYNWTAILKNIAADYELFNGYAIEVKRTANGNVYSHLDFANCRVGIDGQIAYAPDWITDKRTKNFRPEITWFAKYRPDDLEQKRAIIYHVDYRPNFKYYPLPVYIGSLAEIKTDVNIGDYWLNEVENGFVGGTLIQHNNGVPETQEEKHKFEEEFAKKFGNPNGTKIIHLFAPSKENGAHIENLNGNDLHERYGAMSERVKESIFIGHRITNPILFGVKTEGQLGGRNELDLAYEIFTNTYVKERQQTILNTIQKLAAFEGVTGLIEIENLKPVDKVNLTSEVIIANLTQDEIRELITQKTGLELQPLTVAIKAEFSEDDISHLFEAIGEQAEKYEVLNTFDIDYNSKGQPIEFNTDKEEKEERDLLAILLDNPFATALGIATLLDISANRVLLTLNKLIEKDLINVKNSELSLTSKGKREADKIKVPDAKIMYRYELRSDAPALSQGGESRPFCQRMMSMDKLYSREQIEMLRNDMKKDFSNSADVWLARGGWYRNPSNPVAVPFCRHIWKQVLVRER